jgi:hypothetical protein
MEQEHSGELKEATRILQGADANIYSRNSCNHLS